MIAHKKQFKIAGAIWLVIVMTFCQIVPAFASVPTDESGDFLPSNYTVSWSIYNTETQRYDYVNVTSSLTVDGLSFTFPYNTTGVIIIDMFLDSPYSNTANNYYINGFDIEGYLRYDADYQNGFVSLTQPTRYYVYSYDYPSSSIVNSYLEGSTSNPFSFVYAYDSLGAFQTIRVRFYVSIVSGQLTINFSRFIVGGDDISSKITVQNLDNAGDDLSNLSEDLAVPTPNSDAIFNGMDDAINHVNDSNYQSTYSFFKNDTGIMATYITIVLAMATLGYIFFGKRSA